MARMYRRLLWTITLSIVTSGSASSVLVSAPIPLSSEQCGCNNELYALTPSVELPNDTVPIHIDLTAFFSFNTDINSSNCLKDNNGAFSTSHLVPAALIALDEINNSSDILKGYHLQLDVRNSQCDPARALYEFADSIAGQQRLRGSSNKQYNLGVLGPGCASTTEAVSGLNDISVQLPIVSYGPPPVVKERLPTLFTSPSLLLTMRSAIGVLRHFNWTNNIAFLSEDSDVFILTIENVIVSSTNGNSINLKDSIGEIPVQVFAKMDARTSRGNSLSVKYFLDSVREKNIRVIIALVSQEHAAELVCMVKSTGAIPGDGYVYVFVGSFASDWWERETEFCTLTAEDVQSALVISGSVIQPDVNMVLTSGRTVHDFKVEYAERLHMWCNTERYHGRVTDTAAGSVYDSVWAFALALNQSTGLLEEMVENGTQSIPDILKDIVKNLELVHFQGVTGSFYFANGLQARPDTIQQVQGVLMTVVAHYGGQVVLEPGVKFVWNGTNNSIIPSDKPTRIEDTIAVYWLVIVSVFTMAGFIFGTIMCFFNGYYAHHKILIASSQRLNYVIIVGVFFGYFTVFILTILNSPLASIVNDTIYKVLCSIRIWLLPLSFTFTYGIMFSRAWRIYRIFSNPWSNKRFYKDQHLLLIVLGAVSIDVLILVPWTIIDPYRRFIQNGTVNYNHFSQRYFSSCNSSSFAWLAILSAYKIIFIAICVLIMSLAREYVVRKKIFDDSRSLAAAVYITSASFLVGLPLTFIFLFAQRHLLSYLVSALWVNISSSGTLICIFLPKFYKIVIKKDSGMSYKTARSLYCNNNSSVYTKNTYSQHERTTRTSFSHINQADLNAIRGASSLSDSTSEREETSPIHTGDYTNKLEHTHEEISSL